MTVTNAGGTSSAGDFTFNAVVSVPVITGMSPNNGSETGGTVVTITGTNFAAGSTVSVDGETPITPSIATDGLSLTFTTLAHVPETVPVTVTNGVLTSSASSFTFNATPVTTIDTVTPGNGPEAGGTLVTITGTCFTGATGVLFGTTAATSFTVISDTEISAVSPAGTGIADITVVGATACGNATLPDGFTYDPAAATPVITGLSPNNGPETGGTVVTISGTGFAAGSTVSVGGGAAITPDSIASDGLSLTFTTPAHVPATVPVTVTSAAATSAPSDFTFDAVSGGTTIDEVTPDTGPTTGGTTVTITGTCFTGATGVLFGTTAATSFTVISDTEIRAVSPAGTGTVDITVVGAVDCGDATATDGFNYVVVPAPVTPAKPGDDKLPATGVDVSPSAWTAFGLLFAGLALMVLGRRRRTS